MERAVSVERIKLEALRHAATLRPASKLNGGTHSAAATATASHDLNQPPRPKRGKEKGTISNQWRAVMGRMVKEVGQEPFPPNSWYEAARTLGYSMEIKSIRDWLRRGVGAQLGFIDRHGDSYSVSALAIEKFNLKTATPSPEVSSDGVA
jgi:hypothetical protein